MPDGNPGTASNSTWRSPQWLAKEGESKLLNSLRWRAHVGTGFAYQNVGVNIRPTNAVGLGCMWCIPTLLRGASNKPRCGFPSPSLLLLVGFPKHPPAARLLLIVCGSAVPTTLGRGPTSRPSPFKTTTKQRAPSPQPCAGADLLSWVLAPGCSTGGCPGGPGYREKGVSDQKWSDLIPFNLRWAEKPIHLWRERVNMQFFFLLPVNVYEKVYEAKQDPLTARPWGAFVNQPEGQHHSSGLQGTHALVWRLRKRKGGDCHASNWKRRVLSVTLRTAWVSWQMVMWRENEAFHKVTKGPVGCFPSDFTCMVSFEIVPCLVQRPLPRICCHCASPWVVGFWRALAGVRSTGRGHRALLLSTKASAWPLPPVVSAQRSRWLSQCCHHHP